MLDIISQYMFALEPRQQSSVINLLHPAKSSDLDQQQPCSKGRPKWQLHLGGAYTSGLLARVNMRLTKAKDNT
jgi:hypothetical protein